MKRFLLLFFLSVIFIGIVLASSCAKTGRNYGVMYSTCANSGDLSQKADVFYGTYIKCNIDPCCSVVMYPIEPQIKTFTADLNEDSNSNEEFRTQLGNTYFDCDVSVEYQIVGEPDVMRLFAVTKDKTQGLDSYIRYNMRNNIRDALQKVAYVYKTPDNLATNFIPFQDSVSRAFTTISKNDGITISRFSIINRLRWERVVQEQIEATVQRQMQEQKAETAIKTIEAESRAQVEQARADSAEMVIRAAGERKAFEIKTQNITPSQLKYREIEMYEKMGYKATIITPNGGQIDLLTKQTVQ